MDLEILVFIICLFCLQESIFLFNLQEFVNSPLKKRSLVLQEHFFSFQGTESLPDNSQPYISKRSNSRPELQDSFIIWPGIMNDLFEEKNLALLDSSFYRWYKRRKKVPSARSKDSGWYVGGPKGKKEITANMIISQVLSTVTNDFLFHFLLF